MKFAFAVVLSVLSLLAAAGGRTVVGNGALEIRLADESRSFAVEAVVNRLDGETRFVNGTADGKGPHLFELGFSQFDATGGVKRAFVSDRSACRGKKLTKDGNAAVIELRGYDLPGEPNAVDVTATVTLPDGESYAEWRIKVASRSAKWGLDTTKYPCLRRVAKPGEADVLLPHAGLGARLLRKFDGNARNLACAWGEYEYPSYYPMVTAYMIGDAGMVVYPDDPDARVKKLWANNLDCWFETPVENAGLAGKAAEGPGYAVRTEVFCGDWWKAAQAYRRWALRQKWCAKGRIADRADYPKTMSEPSLWYCHYWWGAQGFTIFFARIKREAPDVKLGVRWYDWSLPGFGVYPEAFPAKAGVDEAGRGVGDLGYTLMPYLNARIWDSILLSYDYAKKDMCLRADGTPFTEQWGRAGTKGIRRRRDYGIMCPGQKDWQNVLAKLTKGALEETHATALYYDQLGCAAPRGCRNPAHGHPLGGGRWWADGNREILRQAHAYLSPKGFAVATEGTAECYMDDCDGFLAVTAPTVEDVPFYAAVYSGYTIYFGSRAPTRIEPKKAYPLMARDFVWGFANGTSDDWRGKGIPGENCDAMLQFARARQKYADYLVLGTILGDLKPLDPLPEVAFTAWNDLHGRRFPAEGKMPAVIGAWWRDTADKTVALVAVNVSDTPQTVRFSVPEGYGQSKDSSLALKSRDLDIIIFEKAR